MNNKLFTYLFILLASLSFLTIDVMNSSFQAVFSNLLSFLNGERFNIIILTELLFIPLLLILIGYEFFKNKKYQVSGKVNARNTDQLTNADSNHPAITKIVVAPIDQVSLSEITTAMNSTNNNQTSMETAKEKEQAKPEEPSENASLAAPEEISVDEFEPIELGDPDTFIIT